MRKLIFTAAVLACAAGAAHAEPIVLEVDGGDIFVGLGARDGIGAGTELELMHEVVAKDPRTGATLKDHFAIGRLVVAKSGDTVSIAHADPELAKRVLAGDHVELAGERHSFVDPWQQQVDASRAAAAPAPAGATNDSSGPAGHAALARAAWQETLGASPEVRIARWTALEAADPATPYRRAIEAEVTSLRAQITARDNALAHARSADPNDRAPRITKLVAALEATHPLPPALIAGDPQPLLVAAIDHAVPGKPIGLAFLARSPAAIAHAWLYARAAGDPGYRRSELRRDGDAYLRGTIEGDLVKSGTVEWYVEAAGARDRDSFPAIGSSAEPRTIEIDRAVGEAPIAQGRSHVDLRVDYVDFDGGLQKGFDQYYQAEADFGYRFLSPVYAMRLGFGTLSGIGGPKQYIDAAPTTCVDPTLGYMCTRITFTYVYTELEWRLRPNVAVMIRPQIGLLTTDTMAGSTASRCEGSNTTDCSFETGVGARARLRLGDEDGTNLVLGAAFSRGVGALFEAAYHWLPHPVVPVQLTVQVTDQPVITDFGVRLIADVGLKKLPWFFPSLRVSYQARDIQHAGVSGGAAFNFDW